MSKRPPPQEAEFGSDSFLDVIANIVGILVILIVLAGLKVSRMPVVAKTPANAEATAFVEALPIDPSEAAPAEAPAIDPPTELISTEVVAVMPAALPEPPEIERPIEPETTIQQPPPARVITLSPSPTLQLEADRASQEARDLEVEVAMLASQMKEHERSLAEARSAASEMAADLDGKREVLRSKQDRLVTAHQELVAAKEKLAKLRTRVIETEFAPPNVEKIEHRVTPVGRVVQGGERHYRFERGRVCEVPIDSLVAQVKRQMESRKDWLVKTPKAQGEVGPVGGFAMRYTVQRENAGVLSELEMGPGMVSISVTQWLVQPTPDLRTESVEEAMKPGSNFYRTLLTAPEESTLTFWVYPDSFDEFQKLRKFVHQQGFMVAARPLPKGVPIAGSPHGSRSSAQ